MGHSNRLDTNSMTFFEAYRLPTLESTYHQIFLRMQKSHKKIRKLHLIAALAGSLGMNEIYANTSSTPTPPQKYYMPQLYAGMSLGVQRLKGRRSEITQATSDRLVPLEETVIFSDHLHFSNNNGYYSAHVGLTWDVPNVPLFFGPEIYLGRGNTTTSLKQTVFEIDNNLKRTLSASISQSSFWGGSLQIGLNYQGKLRPYLLFGIDKSVFEYTGTYTPRSEAAIDLILGNPGIDLSDTFLKTRKWLRAFFWGGGIEKQFNNWRIGADVRVMRYKDLKSAYKATTVDPETLFSSFKPNNIRFGLKASYLF